MDPKLRSFNIHHGNFQLRILLLGISDLRIHEEVLEELEYKLMQDILTRNKLLDPIIVDAKTKVVLDGTHRLAALRKIGVKFIPSCLVDYSSSEVGVKRWIRGVKFGSEASNISFLRDISVKLVKERIDEAIEAVNKGERDLAIVNANTAYITHRRSKDAIECSWVLRKVEKYFRENGARINYLTMEDSLKLLLKGNIDLLLIYRPIRKKDVILAGKTGRLFAHKSTRHIISARPLGVDAPLSLLSGDYSEVNEKFVKFLSQRKLITLGENIVVKDRRYEEYVYMFSGLE